MATFPQKCVKCAALGQEIIFNDAKERNTHHKELHGYIPFGGKTGPRGPYKKRTTSASAFDQLLDIEQQMKSLLGMLEGEQQALITCANRLDRELRDAREVHSEIEAVRDMMIDKANTISQRLNKIRQKSGDGTLVS